jgi:hypothetical protein
MDGGQRLRTPWACGRPVGGLGSGYVSWATADFRAPTDSARIVIGMARRRRKPRPTCIVSAPADTPDLVRLTIELVPSTCWFSNVRSAVSTEEWDLIRHLVYRQAGHRCEVCGSRGPQHPVECHEIWHYDDEQLVQRLAGMTALCPACHEVKHIGFAGVRGRRDQAARHLAAVNGWTAEQTAAYIDDVFAVWASRSERRWALDLTALATYGIAPPPEHDGYVFAEEAHTGDARPAQRRRTGALDHRERGMTPAASNHSGASSASPRARRSASSRQPRPASSSMISTHSATRSSQM